MKAVPETTWPNPRIGRLGLRVRPGRPWPGPPPVGVARRRAFGQWWQFDRTVLVNHGPQIGAGGNLMHPRIGGDPLIFFRRDIQSETFELCFSHVDKLITIYSSLKQKTVNFYLIFVQAIVA